MSLQVWLPLNGNLNNQGLSDVTVTNSGATIDSNGKIGSCYLVNKSSRISFNSYPWMTMKPQYNFSCFFWVKGTTSGWLFACSAWEFRLRPDYIQVHLGGSGAYAARYTDTFDTDTWYHLGFTWNGTEGKLRLYLNGNLVATSDVPSSASYDIASSFNIPYDGPRYINDFRLYDHCLSAKEVKEISKGLVCHYKLDNNGFGNSNLCPLTNNQEWTAVGTNAYYTTLALSTSNFGLSAGDTFTWSIYVKVPTKIKTLRARVQFYNSDSDRTNYTGDTYITNGEGKISVTGTILSGYSRMELLIDYNSSSDILSTNVVCYYKMPKLEKGSVATPWCPHSSDSLYTSLGLSSTTESDCSGLSNNGTKIGGLSSSTNPLSIRYESCYDFNGSTGSIQIPNLAKLVPSGEFTMNCWIYHDNTWSSEGYETIFGGPSGFELDAKHSGTKSPVLYACDWGKGRAAYELNKWNMITMTRNTSETKFYINGELKITGTAGTIPSGNYFIGAWKTSNEQNYKGRISDFRLYSTVLSVEDIKTLHNTSASIDKNGNMYAYEFKEE